MERITQPSNRELQASSSLFRAMCLCTGDMHEYGKWIQRQSVTLQLVDCVFRGVAQVMFVNNPLSGFLITVGLFLQNPWWGLNGLLGTLVSTMSAVVLLGHDRGGILAGLYGYNGTLVGMLMAVFSAKGDWYWWLLLPNMFMSMLCPVVSSALSSVTSKWDVPVFTLPFNILLCLHLAATGHDHPYFPGPFITKSPPRHHNGTMEGLDVSQLFLAVPVGVSQVYGCDNPWSAGVFLLALLISSPTICLHATLGSAVGVLSGLALAASHGDIYSGLWGYNSALSCAAIGGMFYALTWQAHLLALTCAFFCAYMTAAISNLMSTVALPACTWPFCLSTLIFLLLSSETPAICRLPLSVVSYPEKNLQYYRELRDSERSKGPQQIYCSGSQSGLPGVLEGTPEVPSEICSIIKQEKGETTAVTSQPFV